MEIPPALANLISESIRQGIAQGLQQRASSEVSGYVSRHSQSLRSQPIEGAGNGRSRAATPSNVSQGSLSEEDVILDQNLSEDEGLEPDQPSFVGLFRPQIFRSLLFKAQTTMRLGGVPSRSEANRVTIDPTSSLFEEPSIQAEVVPAPKLFSDVVQRQWSFPSSGPLPNGLDKRFYNMASDFSNLLQVPSVDAPVVALSSSPITGPPDESLRPEDKKAERTLIKGHQASSWSIQASSATSFFNRASVLWLNYRKGFPLRI